MAATDFNNKDSSTLNGAQQERWFMRYTGLMIASEKGANVKNV